MPEDLPSLKKLAIRSCRKLIISVQNFPLLSELEIHGCHEVIYKGFVDYSSIKIISFVGISKFSWAAECLRLRSTKVESFEIGDCEELCSSRENNWGLLTQSMSPQYLRIEKCPQLVSIATEEEREELMQLKIPSSIVTMTIRNCERLERLSTTLYSLTLLMKLLLNGCPKLVSVVRSNLPSNLKVLWISFCKNLQCVLLDEGEAVDSNNACVLQKLNIVSCESLKRINRSVLPSTLKTLQIHQCPKLESISQEIQDNSSLESIEIYRCDMLKGLPQGLNKLKHFTSLYISNCSNLISLAESGLPTTNLEVLRFSSCRSLQALPGNMHSLNALKGLAIWNCPNVESILEGGIPTNLTSLSIGGPKIWKAILERDLHALTCLKSLSISNGCPNAVSFPQDEKGVTLPSSLTSLFISDFPKLENLSSNGFRNLTSLQCLIIENCPNLKTLPGNNMLSLQCLTIENCPNLKSLPGNNMLSSLFELEIRGCPMMEERCKRGKGPEWSKITHIPRVAVRE
ncbi:putative disease resistance protein At3g14460 [Gossypium raimondii]|uniref:putative disease resistance protein At3g14460 n=1 Tax=Gossypium raimondii TaxID=29730 RepID=UPI00227A3B67|nr:putative disease resistance protein At3g14460 [Gossypium raimondii]